METHKQNPDFVHIGRKLLEWFRIHGRILPFRKEINPYKIWISEVIFQQTRIAQGMGHYTRFIERFPDVQTLADADTDEVLLYWKGLGYYSRALNLHKASKQIMDTFGGKFPKKHEDILTLRGVGKYTAAAIASIAFDEAIPAVDGNFYRVLSRLFADDFDISHSKAFQYFSALAMKIMPSDEAGNFNQAVMDLGSEICKPKKPNCIQCPIIEDCLAFQFGSLTSFPVKNKKISKVSETLNYFFITHEKNFLIKQRGNESIWKSLYDFPTEIPKELENQITDIQTIKHELTHKTLHIHIHTINLKKYDFEKIAKEYLAIPLSYRKKYTFPKPLSSFLNDINSCY